MSGPRKFSTSFLSVLLSSALVSAPLAAQEDFELPEGDFELPEGDFETLDSETDEGASASDPKNDDSEAAPVSPPAKKRTPVAAPESPPASAADTGPSKVEPKDSSDDARNEATLPAPISPRPPLDRGPLTSTDTVELETELPPEADEGGALFWITTGVGTALGVAVIAGLGVGGAVLFGPNLGPQGSVTVTPR